MKALKRWFPIIGALAISTAAMGASPTYVCGLTGKQSKTCCCEQKSGKFICKYTQKTLTKCCCTTK